MTPAILLLLLPSIISHGERITLDEYLLRLKSIRKSLDADDHHALTAAASSLLSCEIDGPSGPLTPDGSLLLPIAQADSTHAARRLAPKLDLLIASLREETPPSATPDKRTLERIRESEQLFDPTRGGQIKRLEVEPPDFHRSFLDRLGEIWTSIENAIRKFIRWLYDFLFGKPSSSGSDSTSILVFVVVAVIGVVLAIATFLVLKKTRAQKALPAESTRTAPPAEDADPLSRTASEWETYAARLIKERRFREAIRAWYHALLIALYRRGLLHYRRDRTNWEYAYALPADLPWRPTFFDLTRSFEIEWYGRRESSSDTTRLFADQARQILGTLGQGGALL